MFRNVGSDYKVIIVGDAAMAPEELYSDTGNYRGPNGGLSGYEWLQLMKKKYKKIVWLNPKMAPGRAPWREAETAVKELFPMYKLTVDGLNQAMQKLMSVWLNRKPGREFNAIAWKCRPECWTVICFWGLNIFL